MRRWALMIAAALCVTFNASATICYVDKDNTSGVEDGASWATAFTTIQPAIDAAHADGRGTYVYDGEQVIMNCTFGRDKVEEWFRQAQGFLAQIAKPIEQQLRKQQHEAQGGNHG